MKRMGMLIRAELNELSNDAAVLNRTKHMLNRSRRSLRLSRGGGNRNNLDGSGSGSLRGRISRRLSQSFNKSTVGDRG